jgi:hypothetical protein
MESPATRRIEALYQLRHENEVWAFLDQHSFLIPLLLAAEPQIKHHFTDAQLFLEVYSEPESINSQSLLISIVTCLDVEQAFTKRAELHRDWWFKHVHEAQNKLGLYVEMATRLSPTLHPTSPPTPTLAHPTRTRRYTATLVAILQPTSLLAARS